MLYNYKYTLHMAGVPSPNHTCLKHYKGKARQGKTKQRPTSPPCSCSDVHAAFWVLAIKQGWSGVIEWESGHSHPPPIRKEIYKTGLSRPAESSEEKGDGEVRSADASCLHELNNWRLDREWMQRCRELVKISGRIRELYCWEGCVATLLKCKLDRGEDLQF
jgi:hypothetical protein